MSETRPATQLRLPWAPSVGMYWRPFAVESGKRCPVCKHGFGRTRPVLTLTKEARLYRTDVAVAVRRQLGGKRLEAYATPVQVDLELRAPDRRRRDVDNFCKGVLDALTFAGVWIDDSQIDQLNIRRGRVLKGGAVLVLIAPLDAPADEPAPAAAAALEEPDHGF
jgi:crossover junction endodeoxyribonuclease RusA